MKVLSKYLKVALCFMAFALCSFMFAFSPTYTAVQAAEMAIESYNVAINALKMPTEEVNYDEGDEFNIPLLTSSTAMGTTAPTNYTIRVIDPTGVKHDFVVGTSSTNNFFAKQFEASQEQADKLGLVKGNQYLSINAKNDGEYKIVYIVSEGSGEAKRTYYSNTYKVKVSNLAYELDFSTPIVEEIEGAQGDEDKFKITGYTKNLVKTAMAPSSTTSYELPIAYAKRVNKDLTINQTTGKVSNDAAEINITFSPQDGTYTGDVYTTRVDENGIKRYSINPTEEGVYTVEYFYSDSANRPTKTYTIVVDEDFEVGKLKLASTPTMPKIELGKTVILPKLTVNSGTEKNIDVDITSVVISKEGNANISYELTNNNLEFVMNPETFGVESYDELVGNYRITYTAKSVYDEQQPLTETFKVDGVNVSTNPTIKLSYNYDLETDATGVKTIDPSNVVFGAETELELEYEKDTEFVLPAVYVEDSVTTDFRDFFIVRTIRKGNRYYYLDNLKYNETTGEFDEVLPTDAGYNASGDTANIGDPTKAVKFKFNSTAEVNKDVVFTGTYYLEYSVISKQVKERKSVLYIEGDTDKYSFQVVNTVSDYTDPIVTITNLRDSSVKNTDNITVKVTATDSRDARLKNVVFTHAGVIDANKIDGKTTFEQYLELVEGNLRAKVGTNKYRHILDDDRLIYGWDNDGKKAQDPATAENKGLAYYFNDVTRLTENNTKNNFDLKLTNKSGKVYVVAATQNDGGAISTADEKVLTIKDTKDATEPEINIYAKKLPDAWKEGSNITEFKVGQGEKVDLPSVYVVDADKTLNLNVMYYIIPKNNINANPEYLSTASKTFYYDKVVLEGESEATEVQVINGGSIITSEIGIYYVAYTATDVAGNTSVMYFTFEVEDTSKPILSVEPVGDEISISGNTITASTGAVIDFETTLKSANAEIDYTSDENITITVEDGGKGLDYQPSGNSRTSYRFNTAGTYFVTVSGQYKIGVDDKGTLETEDDEILYRTADNKVLKVVIEKQDLKWLGEFNVTEYAKAGEPIRLPYVAANNGAEVTVKYIAPGDTLEDAVEATPDTDASGYSYWTFTTSATAKGTFKVIYTATSADDVLTKELTIKVGDYQPPTLTFNAGELTQNFVYDGENSIDYILEVNKKNKTFVVRVINNGKEVVSHDIGLVISDTDDTLSGGNVDTNWSKLEYELTGDNVTKGETSTNNNTTTTHYTISGPGSYSLRFTATDNNENVNDRESIDFKVVTKSSADEKDSTVVGAVLIVISLVLLAGVILFFAFTGKKGGKKTKTSKKSSGKTTSTKEVKAEEKPEVTTEEVVEEQAETVEEKVDDEPKTGDVE